MNPYLQAGGRRFESDYLHETKGRQTNVWWFFLCSGGSQACLDDVTARKNQAGACTRRPFVSSAPAERLSDAACGIRQISLSADCLRKIRVDELYSRRSLFQGLVLFARPQKRPNTRTNCTKRQVHPQNSKDLWMRMASIEDFLEEGDGAGEDFFLAAGDEVVFAIDFHQGGAGSVGFQILLAAPHRDDGVFRSMQ